MTSDIGQGFVIAITHDQNFGEEVLVVKNEQETVYVLSSEVKVANPINFMGFDVEYLKTQRIQDRQYASIAQLQTRAVNELKNKFLQNSEAQYLAQVLSVETEVARIRIQHCIARLERCNITVDPVSLTQWLEVGDWIEVKIKFINKEFIEVEAVDKKQAIGVFELSDLQEEDLVYGIVNSTKTINRKVDDSYIKALHSFVTIARGVDGLAPIQNHRPVEVGQKVIFKVNQIFDDGRVRGKILRVLDISSHVEETIFEHTLGESIQIGDTVSGQVRLIREDFQLGEKVLIVISQGQWIIVPYSELSGEDLAMNELGWMGRKITIKIIKKEGRLIGSKKQKDIEERERFIAEWRKNLDVIKVAYVKEKGSIGYILRIGREEVYLLKADYRQKSGSTSELEVNDKIYVQLQSIQGNTIKVEWVPNPTDKDLELLGVSKEDFHYTKRSSLPSYEAIITKVMKKGAYLSIDGIRVFLPNTLFSLDLTRVMDIYQVGDVIPVKLHAYVDHTIVVRSGHRFINESWLKPSELNIGMLIYGIVRKIDHNQNDETKSIFTSIGFKLEGLSPQSEYFEVEEGDAVIFRINQIKENGNIRGRIVRKLAT